MKFTFLGTGTSHGVPVIACQCKVCKSKNPKDKRYRSSGLLQTNNGENILIDIGPEFRLQAIENHINKIDSVLLTHSHADHLHGIDDLRIFSCAVPKQNDNQNNKKTIAPPISIYTNQNTKIDIEKRFPYLFQEVKEGGGRAKINVISADSKFSIGNTEITPIPMMHGSLPTVGWLFSTIDEKGNKNSIAYLTDCNYISPESIDLIKQNCGSLKHLIIDGLRIKPHSTHFSFLEALDAAQKIGGEHIWITHLTHASSHKETKKYLKDHLKEFPKLKDSKSVLPAYDKLTIEC